MPEGMVHYSAQLAFLLARGLTMDDIVDHMGLEWDAVWKLAKTMGFKFATQAPFYYLSAKSAETYKKAAQRRRVSMETVLERVVNIVGEDPTLLRNVLDDGQ